VAWLFVRLKLSLITGGLRGPGGSARAAGLIIAIIGALWIMPGGFALLATQRGRPGAANLAVMVFAVFAVGWLVLPMVTFGADETLDPARLMLLPLRPATLARGLMAAALTGIGPVVTFVILIGAVVAASSGTWAVLAGIVAVAIELGICVAGSRALVTATSGLLRSRRGRDLGVLVGAALTLAIFGMNLAFQHALTGSSGPGHPSLGADLAPAARIARWTPPGMVAHAITDAGAGRYPMVVAELGAGVVTVALLAWIWIGVLGRALVTADTSTGARVPGPAAWPPLAVSAAGLPAGQPAGQPGGQPERHPAGRPERWWRRRAWASRSVTAAGRELRYYRRDPRRKQQVVNLAMPVLLIVVNSPLALGSHGPLGSGQIPVWPAVLGGALAGMFSSANQFGMDGSPLWMNVVATARWQDLRADIAGKNLAGIVITVPVFAVVYALLGLLTGDAEGAAVAFSLLLCAAGATGAVAAMVSVLLPVPVPERRSSAFSGGGAGQGCLSALATIAGVGVAVAAMIPVLVLQAEVRVGAWLLLIAPAYGALLAWAGRRAAAMVGYRRLPEMLAAVGRAL